MWPGGKASGLFKVALTEFEALDGGKPAKPFLRITADTLVLFRFGLAASIVSAGIIAGSKVLWLALVMVMVGQFTDAFDGFIARCSNIRQTWIGKLDWSADLALVYSFFLFLVVSDLFPSLPAAAIVLASLAVVIWQPRESVVDMVTAPIYALPIVVSFTAGLLFGLCYVSFVLTVLIVRRERVAADARKARDTAEVLAEKKPEQKGVKPEILQNAKRGQVQCD